MRFLFVAFVVFAVCASFVGVADAAIDCGRGSVFEVSSVATDGLYREYSLDGQKFRLMPNTMASHLCYSVVGTVGFSDAAVYSRLVSTPEATAYDDQLRVLLGLAGIVCASLLWYAIIDASG